MSRPGPLAPLVAALALLALTVACSQPPPGPSPESYAATADRVCEEGD
jgi:hypothetical protein